MESTGKVVLVKIKSHRSLEQVTKSGHTGCGMSSTLAHLVLRGSLLQDEGRTDNGDRLLPLKSCSLKTSPGSMGRSSYICFPRHISTTAKPPTYYSYLLIAAADLVQPVLERSEIPYGSIRQLHLLRWNQCPQRNPNDSLVQMSGHW